MATIELWCEAGKHSWQRESQRGRRPHHCPKHAPVKMLAPTPAEGERFTEEELALEHTFEATPGLEQPTFKQLSEALQKNGYSDSILESGRHLPEEQYYRLAELCKRYPENLRVPHRRKNGN